MLIEDMDNNSSNNSNKSLIKNSNSNSKASSNIGNKKNTFSSSHNIQSAITTNTAGVSDMSDIQSSVGAVYILDWVTGRSYATTRYAYNRSKNNANANNNNSNLNSIVSKAINSTIVYLYLFIVSFNFILSVHS